MVILYAYKNTHTTIKCESLSCKNINGFASEQFTMAILAQIFGNLVFISSIAIIIAHKMFKMSIRHIVNSTIFIMYFQYRLCFQYCVVS